MTFKSIELLLLQLETAFSKSRSNSYSDNNKEEHFNELHCLFIEIKNSNYKSFGKNDLVTHIQVLNYIFTGLEYLDNSTLNVIPYEIVSCLEFALADWITSDNFIIVTSLSNKITDFYFESSYNEDYFNKLNDYIQSHYSIIIKHRLIRICLPKVLSRDYLSIVVLYHELGHFIDNELNISSNLTYAKFGYKTTYLESEMKYYRHTMEYFADLFAAQYINNASSSYLNYIASEQGDSSTHPATKRRIEVVDKFINGVNCDELNEFNRVLAISIRSFISIRHTKIELVKSDLLLLIPQEVSCNEELHYIFKLGWDFWDDSGTNFLKDFRPRQKYNIINNLIEKSISNFTVTQKWAKLS
ncbi:M48 family metalloprotease [Aureibaculum luteum]|uniref:hypothetical protein n=1 Tax=Aureibaculum luteum TaxID=1548456 RepID=UPI000E492E53|nr:hypothetical protein [Aureibaculum luteum]